MTVDELRAALEGQDGDLEVRVMQVDAHGCQTRTRGIGQVAVRPVDRLDTRRLAWAESKPGAPRRGSEALVLR